MTSEPLLIELPAMNFKLELVHIPAGPFLMGSGDSDREFVFSFEKPQHTVTLGDYYIGKYPVTNEQWAVFAQATERKFDMPDNKARHPVVNITWHDSIAFCNWLSRVSTRKVTLPSEAEWEKAARGTDGRIYPWGDAKPTDKLISLSHDHRWTTPIGEYSPQSDSPYGCVDMIGNVCEWTRSLWGYDVHLRIYDYPYVNNDGREDLGAEDRILRVIRGRWWRSLSQDVRAAMRFGKLVSGSDPRQGFRPTVFMPS